MRKPLTIVARIEARQGKVDQLKAALLKLIEPSRQEAGCLQYDLHQDNETPAVFVFYENWESRALWQVHMNKAHLKAYMEEADSLVASFTVNEMCQIG
ncbi:putative quinol monooxygenase [Kistimonas scapharcae]|uniref:Quinol monooxygenase n=1 Tax=Kistimonas scapharcae TaxID=1036133 RepID=A0ABP8V0N6_9GAMM